MNLNSKPVSNSYIMPLLMNFTPSTKIQEETNPFEYIYNDGKQIVAYDMRLVGTKSLKVSTTWINVPGQKGANSKRGQTDKKNEIDDQENV